MKLADGGIDRIRASSWSRALSTIKDFAAEILANNVTKIDAVGTAALRTAANGQAFLDEILRVAGIKVELIDGLEEAQLIYQGVKKIWSPQQLPAMIMDIGGGSVEYIIADQHKIHWASSFPVGVAILYHRFHQSDPISEQEKQRIRNYLVPHLAHLAVPLSKHQPISLIGASGTFDVIQQFAGFDMENAYSTIEISEVNTYLQQILGMDLQTRKDHPLIPNDRTDMIVVAVLLLLETLALHPFEFMAISRYALKEGLI